MFDLDHWREIKETLLSNKVRTLLTAFGVFWGIFMLMVLLGLGNGLKNAIYGAFSGTAANSVALWSRSTSVAYRGLPEGRSIDLTLADAAAIRQQVPEVELIAPRAQLGGFGGGNNVVRGLQSGAFNVKGDVPAIQQIESIRVVRGRFLNPKDMEEKRKVVVIGTRVEEVLFEEGEDPLGESVVVGGVYFKVVGVFNTRRSGDGAEQDEETLYLPLSTFQQAFHRGDRVGWFSFTARADVPASTMEERILTLLKRRHRVAPEDLRAFGSFNLEREFQKIQGVLQGIAVLIWIIGLGTLLAGVIGVSNIMLIVVKERTAEIGIRRAVGATPFAITRQIVLEAILLTALAGYVGLVVGVGLMEGLTLVLQQLGAAGPFNNPGVELGNALLALGILVFAGTLAGLVPAWRALAIRPVNALRAE